MPLKYNPIWDHERKFGRLKVITCYWISSWIFRQRRGWISAGLWADLTRGIYRGLFKDQNDCQHFLALSFILNISSETRLNQRWSLSWPHLRNRWGRYAQQLLNLRRNWRLCKQPSLSWRSTSTSRPRHCTLTTFRPWRSGTQKSMTKCVKRPSKSFSDAS